MNAHRTERVRMIASVAFASMFLSPACSQDEKATPPDDTVPPAAVTNLAVESIVDSSVTLVWTAPGDDGDAGRAATYDLRFAPGDSTTFIWEQATRVTGVPPPLGAGSDEIFTVTGSIPGTTYTFALETADERANWSAMSNLVSAQPGGGTTGCQVSPTALLFDSVLVGHWRERSFTITGSGRRPVVGTVSANCDPFTVTNGGGAYSLAPGETRVVTVRYAPAEAGTHVCEVETGASCAYVACTGIATMDSTARCLVDPTTLSFPETVVGSTADLGFTIRNRGAAGILSGSVAESCEDYRIVSGEGAYALTAGEEHTVIVRFEPTRVGWRYCVIEIGASCQPVLCAGQVPDVPPVCEVQPTELDFGDVWVASRQERDITIRNIGGRSLTGSVTANCAHFSMVTGGGVYDLDAGQTRTVRVRYEPTEAGPDSCTIDLGSPVCTGVACIATAHEAAPSCFLADFDDDENPRTLRTVVDSQSVAPFDLILEVGDIVPLGEGFYAFVESPSAVWGDYGDPSGCWAVWMEELEFDSTYVDGYWEPALPYDGHPILEVRVRSDAGLSPGERYVIASGVLSSCSDDVHCRDLPRYVRFPLSGRGGAGADPVLWFNCLGKAGGGRAIGE